MAGKLTPASLALLLSLAEDAPNWSGTPLVTVTPAERGNLTDLKAKGLLVTQEDEDGCVFAYFTAEGATVTAQHGIDLSWIADWPGFAEGRR